MIVSFDTNILIYAGGPAADPRRSLARAVIDRAADADDGAGSGVLLLQTLAEFSNVAIRKLRMPAEATAQAVAVWRAVFPVRAAAEEDLPAALAAVAAHRLQFWDAMLWATAKRTGVDIFFSEDFQDGRTLDGVRFVNPFSPENESLIARIFGS